MASSTSNDTEDNILAVTVEEYLVEISLSSKSSRVLIKHNPLTRDSLFSAPIKNRYVYMLYKSRSCAYSVLDDDDDAGGLDVDDAGGLDDVDAGGLDDVDAGGLDLDDVDAGGLDDVDDVGLDSDDVYVGGLDDVDAYVDVAFFDLRDPDLKLHKVPPIRSSRISELTLIVFGFKLFAFYDYTSDSDHICTVLDTASEPLVWSPLKFCPSFPLGYDDLIPCYSVVSYAINNNDLFLSLGHGDYSFAVCYNDSTHTWSLLSDKPLPFYHQGKFVDGICYGFPKIDSFDFNSLSSYKLSVDWRDSSPIVSCQQLVRYSLHIKYPRYHRSYLYSFFVSSSNNFTIITATNQTFPDKKQQPHSLQVNVVELLGPGVIHPSPPPPRHPCLRPFVPPLQYRTRYVPDDPQGSSRCLEHTSIPFLHSLDVILGDF